MVRNLASVIWEWSFLQANLSCRIVLFCILYSDTFSVLYIFKPWPVKLLLCICLFENLFMSLCALRTSPRSMLDIFLIFCAYPWTWILQSSPSFQSLGAAEHNHHSVFSRFRSRHRKSSSIGEDTLGSRTVDLHTSTIKIDAEDTDLRLCFRIISPAKTYTLQVKRLMGKGTWLLKWLFDLYHYHYTKWAWIFMWS